MSFRQQQGSDSRRSTAAQFFLDDDEVLGQQPDQSTYDRVVELLNQAVLMPKDAKKVAMLKQVQELIIFKEPNLLDNFLDEIVAFQHDKSQDVRKFVVGFLECACKKEPDILPKVIANFSMLVQNGDNPAILKRTLQALTPVYRVALQWICKSKVVDDIMESLWNVVLEIKQTIIELLEHENDGVRTHCIKFVEMVIILQSPREGGVVQPKKDGEEEFNLESVPPNNAILKADKLEEEARYYLETLISFNGQPHISSVNLMTSMQSLTYIAKLRPQFLPRVVLALESLHANLPPTLAKSQVSSVRKHLKLQLLLLLKNPLATEFQTQIVTLLTDLGATPQEINKNIPKSDEFRKRPRGQERDRPGAKRMKLEPTVSVTPMEDEEEEEEDEGSPAPSSKTPAPPSTATAIDITAEDLLPRLTPVNVSDLALVSMLSLPDTMPAHFQASYTPIAVAGTKSQVRHLARLLATQLTAAGLGPGVETLAAAKKQEALKLEEDSKAGQDGFSQSGVGGGIPKKKKIPVFLHPSGTNTSKGRFKQLNLAEITLPRTEENTVRLTRQTLRYYLDSEEYAQNGDLHQVWTRGAATTSSELKGEISKMTKKFILEDLRNRSELAFVWLWQEYAVCRGYKSKEIDYSENYESYEQLALELLNWLLQHDFKEREQLFSKFYLDVPIITEKMLKYLKEYCQNPDCMKNGLIIINSLIVQRPPKQPMLLQVILELCMNEKNTIRTAAVELTKELHAKGDLRKQIEIFALRSLKHLLEAAPPADILPNPRMTPPTTWTEEYTKMCLHLYLSLLPLNHRLIHDLAVLYVGTLADVKRTILRILEAPVKGMGMDSPELLLLVENCPKGAETLVTRIIHILTDKAPPSTELVARVRDLYQKRVPDVRFLIPVLNGLTKKEVIAALPKLIKLNPVVVKEVFNRLLGSHNSEVAHSSPLSPVDLLVALHKLDTTKCDMKTIIKATSLCFAEKTIYTQEILAVVMQQLMDLKTLPTLLMRTVLQSLSLYPRLSGFVMNILQRLILRQVWEQKKVWEGFLKCCQRTKPQSLQVLLQLPAPQLQEVLTECPDLRDPLLEHVAAFSDHQRAHVPAAILSLLDELRHPASPDLYNPSEPTESTEPPPPGQDSALLPITPS